MDTRWKQRHSNYQKALSQLEDAMQLMGERELSNLEKQGVIQAFEFTHELSWKTIKDFLESRGNTEIYGSKDAVRQAFKYGILKSGDIWMQMIESRNYTSHTYDEKTADEIIYLVRTEYFKAFTELEITLMSLEREE